MNTLQKVAFALMVVATVAVGLAIIPLFWCIPMCVSYYRNPNNRSMGFKICTLLFVSVISGILMLVDKD